MATYYRYDEDRRLREMGIDPDGDPIEIMQQVKARRKLLYADEGLTAKEKPAAEEPKKIVDEAEEPR